MSSPIFIKSFAKLNLYLKVFDKRPDGYHNIITLFERINLYDKILIRERSDSLISIHSDSKDLHFDTENIIYRAVDIVRSSLNINRGVDIYIEKSIPIAAGLGGASSDTAAVLLGLNKLWKLNISKEQLVIYAKQLGADVAFFLYNYPFALGKERGDNIEPLPIKSKYWHLLILPHIKILTKDIYLQLDRVKKPSLQLTKENPNVKMLIKGLLKKNISLIEKNIYNQLEMVTLKLYPMLNKLKNNLEKKGSKNIFMSGSGPAMFVIFSSRKEAQWYKEQHCKSSKFRLILTHTI
ncbi:MAG: 4-(cytidine 5'-diphospho)-2-C-methyl-D-erythritol kinase [Candidatus Omnitrophica bacterium]|nr:4-(cytidine 5'-diphospho)-2-C-methyl-D-erythritol kinase [Candidatus Omnitrophota bacterium]